MKYIICIINIILIFCEYTYAYNIDNSLYVVQDNNAEVIQVDVGNHNRRSSSHSSSRRRTKRNSGKNTGVYEIAAKIIAVIALMSIILMKEIVFSKKTDFCRIKKI